MEKERGLPSGYGMVYGAIWESSLAENWEAVVVLMAMLSLADQDDNVFMGARRLSYKTRIPIEIVERGLMELLKPDETSRSSEQMGRRVVPLPWADGKKPDPMELNARGYFIVNRAYYKRLARNSYHRNYMRQRREKEKGARVNITTDNITVIDGRKSKGEQLG